MQPLEFKKGDGIKYISPDSSLVLVLQEQGWVCETLTQEQPAKRIGRPPKA